MKNAINVKTASLLVVLTCFCLLLTQCKNDEPAPGELSITKVEPGSALPGTAIKLSGKKFDTNRANNLVKFNGMNATVTAATNKTLNVIVPVGATTGKITVEVAGKVATSKEDFIVEEFEEEVLVITSFTPESGPPGSPVVIRGAHFAEATSGNSVKINSVSAEIIEASENELTVLVPMNVTSGKISVAANGQTVETTDNFTVTSSSGNDLTITGFTPESAAYGSTVIITGTNFYETIAGNEVKFNTISAEILGATKNKITVVVPNGATTGKITVTANSQTTQSAEDFIVPVPEILSINPAYGNTGDIVTLHIKNLDLNHVNEIEIDFNGEYALFMSNSGEYVRVRVPSNATTGKIRLTMNGQTVMSANDFEFVPGIPYAGLVGFYKFSGDAADASIYGYHGTVSGAVPVSDRYGNASRAYSFSGSGDYISIGNQTWLRLSNAMTVSVWVKTPVFQDEAYILSKANTDIDDLPGGYLLTLQDKHGTPSYALGIATDGSSQPFQGNYLSSAPFVPNVWECIAFTIDGTNMKFYKNGIETNSVTNHARVYNNSAPLVFGRYSHGGTLNEFNGLLDDLMIYSRALTAAEIKQVYDQRLTSRP